MSIDEWVKENGREALEAAQARAGESEVERLRARVEQLEAEAKAATQEWEAVAGPGGEHEVLLDRYKTLQKWHEELLQYVDAAKLACGSHRVGGEPLADSIRVLVERVERTDAALDARLFDVRAAVEIEREECIAAIEANRAAARRYGLSDPGDNAYDSCVDVIRQRSKK